MIWKSKILSKVEHKLFFTSELLGTKDISFIKSI